MPPQALASKAYAGTTKDLDANMQLLGLDQVDLVLLHFPPMTQSCAAMQACCAAYSPHGRAHPLHGLTHGRGMAHHGSLHEP